VYYILLANTISLALVVLTT